MDIDHILEELILNSETWFVYHLSNPPLSILHLMSCGLLDTIPVYDDDICRKAIFAMVLLGFW